MLGLEHSGRLVVHAQVQQEWAQIVELETPARVMSQKVGVLLRKEHAGREATRERAMLVPMLEVSAARRKQGQLPTKLLWGEGDPSGQGGWMSEDPLGDAVLLTQTPMGPQTPVPRTTQPPTENLPQQPDLARHFCQMQHRRPGLKQRRSPQNHKMQNQNIEHKSMPSEVQGRPECVDH